MTENEKKHTWKVILLSAGVCLLSMVPALLVWNKLPDVVPIHFNMQGNPDSWAPKWAAVFGLPAGLSLLDVFVLWATLLHDQNLGRKIKNLCICLLPVLTWGIVFVMLAQWLGWQGSVTRPTFFIVGILFIVLGNYLPKAGKNRFFGLRTGATLSSEMVWNKSNRLCGYLMLIAGIAIVIESLFLTESLLSYFVLAEILAAALIPIVYAEVLYHNEKKAV